MQKYPISGPHYSERDTASYNSKFKNAIGGSYSTLVKASFQFYDEAGLPFVRKAQLPEAFKHPAFVEICKIHEELKKNGDNKSVPNFLLEMVQKQQGSSFLIPYAYFVRKVPSEYSRYVTSVGDAWALPMILDEVGLKEFSEICNRVPSEEVWKVDGSHSSHDEHEQSPKSSSGSSH